jgi:hypothetical protein
MPLCFSALALACSANDPTPSSAESATTPADKADDGANAQQPPSKDDDAKGSPADAGPKGDPDVHADAGDAGDPDPGDGALSQDQIQTLFNSRCTPCHVGGAAAGMSLANDFTKATVGVTSSELSTMKRIEAGDKEKSYLFHKLRGTHLGVGGSGARMPKSGPPYLSDAEIAGIGAYIDGL